MNIEKRINFENQALPILKIRSPNTRLLQNTKNVANSES